MTNPLDIIEYFPNGEPKKYRWEVEHPEWSEPLVDVEEYYDINKSNLHHIRARSLEGLPDDAYETEDLYPDKTKFYQDSDGNILKKEVDSDDL